MVVQKEKGYKERNTYSIGRDILRAIVFYATYGHFTKSILNAGIPVASHYQPNITISPENRMEQDRLSSMILNINFPNIPIQKPHMAIELHDPTEYLDNIDLMVGSPPCIGFSQANPNAREDHPANKHTLNFANWVMKVQPKYFLMEMVPNILTTGRSIWEKFNGIVRGPYGYTCDYQIMEASEYGAAQKRKRLYIWGQRRDLSEIESPLCTLDKRPALTIDEVIPVELSAKFNSYEPDGKQLMSMYKKDGTGLRAGPFSLLSTEEKRKKRTLKWTGQMYTIVGTSTCNCIHPSGKRFLSIPEIKLLMGFPVDYKLPFKLNAQQACRVIASGVDVRFATYLLEHIKDVLGE